MFENNTDERNQIIIKSNFCCIHNPCKLTKMLPQNNTKHIPEDLRISLNDI